MDGRIRARRDDDLEACVVALAEVHELDSYPMHWPVDPRAWLTVRGTLVALVADVDGEVAGHGLVRRAAGTSAAEALAHASGRSVDEIAMVARFFVAPWGRRRGIGRRLLDALVDRAVEQGLTVGLDVVDRDTVAIAMYEQAGWRRVATLPADWAGGGQLVCYIAPPAPPVRPRDHEDFV